MTEEKTNEETEALGVGRDMTCREKTASLTYQKEDGWDWRQTKKRAKAERLLSLRKRRITVRRELDERVMRRCRQEAITRSPVMTTPGVHTPQGMLERDGTEIKYYTELKISSRQLQFCLFSRLRRYSAEKRMTAEARLSRKKESKTKLSLGDEKTAET